MSTIKRPLVTDFKQISAAKIEICMKGTQIISTWLEENVQSLSNNKIPVSLCNYSSDSWKKKNLTLLKTGAQAFCYSFCWTAGNGGQAVGSLLRGWRARIPRRSHGHNDKTLPACLLPGFPSEPAAVQPQNPGHVFLERHAYGWAFAAPPASIPEGGCQRRGRHQPLGCAVPQQPWREGDQHARRSEQRHRRHCSGSAPGISAGHCQKWVKSVKKIIILSSFGCIYYRNQYPLVSYLLKWHSLI